MKVVAAVSFNRDVSKIKDKKLAQKVKAVILKMEAAKSLTEIAGLKKLVGASNAYRIRLGDYRIGFFFISQTIQLTVFAHRKDIYSTFP